jgi:O-antigen/teichoic acid export membrane protein
LKSLIKASMLVVGARITGAILGFALQILLARLIGAEALGIFFLAVSLASVLSIFCSLGYPWIVARFVAEFEANGNSSLKATFIAWVRQEIALVSLLLVSLVLLAVLVLPSVPIEKRLSLALGALTAPIFAYMKLNAGLANAYKRFALAYFPDLLWRPVLFLGLILALWMSATSFDVVFLVAGQLIIVLGLTVIQARWLRDVNDGVLSREYEFGQAKQIQRAHRKKWRHHALPMIIATLFIGVFSDLDLVIIGTLLPASEVAIFGASIKIALFLAFSIQAVHQLILRDAADALQSQDHPLLSAILAKANAINIVTSLGATLAVALFGRDILRLFGPEFIEGYVCLVILVLAQTIRAAAGPATQILTLTGYERNSIPVFGVGLLLLVITNILLVPKFHLVGAALAVIVVTLIWSVGLAYVAWARTGVNTAILPMPGFAALRSSKTRTRSTKRGDR